MCMLFDDGRYTIHSEIIRGVDNCGSWKPSRNIMEEAGTRSCHVTELCSTSRGDRARVYILLESTFPILKYHCSLDQTNAGSANFLPTLYLICDI